MQNSEVSHITKPKYTTHTSFPTIHKIVFGIVAPTSHMENQSTLLIVPLQNSASVSPERWEHMTPQPLLLQSFTASMDSETVPILVEVLKAVESGPILVMFQADTFDDTKQILLQAPSTEAHCSCWSLASFHPFYLQFQRFVPKDILSFNQPRNWFTFNNSALPEVATGSFWWFLFRTFRRNCDPTFGDWKFGHPQFQSSLYLESGWIDNLMNVYKELQWQSHM